MSLRRRLAVLFGCAGAVMVLIAASAGYSLVQLTRARADLVSRAEPATLASAQLLASLADQESGVRGFALTRNDAFLAPYESGRAAERSSLARLARILDHDRRKLAELDAVEQQIGTWHDRYVDPVLTTLRTRPDDFDVTEALTTSKVRFGAVRSALAALDASLAHARSVAAHNLDRSSRTFATLLGTSLALVVGVGLVLALSLRRLVTRPLEVVSADVRLVANGDLTHEITRSGTPELVRLAVDTDEMRQRLVDELQQVSAARAELSSTNEEIARSNVELEQFAYVASHDLQEPLRKVVSFTQLLQQRYADKLDDRAGEYIDFAADGARRMQVLINDLLAFSRVGRPNLNHSDVELDACLSDAKAILAEVIEAADATVTAAPLPVVRGDRSLLTAVFQNLIGNAVKFRTDAPPTVMISVERADELWWFTVTDNGIGIEPRFAERVFVIFQRLHGRAEYEGTGIGLALARKIVEHHGGNLWLDTDHHPGARLCFTLPVDDERKPV